MARDSASLAMPEATCSESAPLVPPAAAGMAFNRPITVRWSSGQFWHWRPWSWVWRPTRARSGMMASVHWARGL